MANITAQMVKDLRDKTGAGMMDCKAALGEAGGNTEAAIDWLRAKGLAKVAKKAGRTAAEGLIGVATEGKRGAIVEVNSETDFVARNAQFQQLAAEIARLALKAAGDAEKLNALPVPGKTITVAEYINEMIASIGENLALRRTAALQVKDGVVASYVHNAAAPGLGKIGVLVALESAGDASALMETGRQIAMHVAAANPLALAAEDIDPEVIERERAILTEQAKESGKPANVIEKMVDGRMRKFYEEAVLTKQAFVIDSDKTVEQAVKAAEEKAGAPVKITGFVRYALGEGIKPPKGDFAAEVAAAAAGN